MSGLANLSRRAASMPITGDAFDPVTFASPTHLWWAEGPEMSLLGYNDSDLIPEWPSEVSSASLVQADPDLRPKFVESDFDLNNKPAVLSVLGDDLLDTMFTLTHPWWVIIIGAFNAPVYTVNQHIFGSNVSPSKPTITFRRAGGDVAFYMYINYSHIDLTSSGVTGGAHMIKYDHDQVSGSNSAFYIDETAGFGSIWSYTPNWANEVFRIFCGTSYFPLAFLAFYSSNPELDDGWESFKLWAEDYYGLTLG